MKRPIFVHPFSDAERETLEAGLRSPDAFTLRRCQILLASTGARMPTRSPAPWAATPRRRATPSTPSTRRATAGASARLQTSTHRSQGFQGPQQAEALRELLHHTPREYGKDTTLWTLDLAAEVSFEEGLTEERITGETVRATLARMGVRWERAKRWITSPIPSTHEKGGATD